MIINLTPHTVIVQIEDKQYRFEPSGSIARVDVEQHQIAREGDIPIMKTKFGEVIDYPGLDQNQYIVSSIVGKVLSEKQIDNYLIPNTSQAIRNSQGQIIAVKSFHKYR